MIGSPTLRAHPVTINEMLDKFALQQLAWTYCHAVDRQDFDLLRTLYHDNATDDHTPMFVGSAADYIDWLPGMLAHWQLTAHRITNMLYLLDGDRAEGELATTAYHRTKDGRRELIAHGRYLDRYEKRDGVWRFLHRSLVLDWMDDHLVTDDNGPRFDKGVALGTPGADDPVFARLPMFLAQRTGGS